MINDGLLCAMFMMPSYNLMDLSHYINQHAIKMIFVRTSILKHVYM